MNTYTFTVLFDAESPVRTTNFQGTTIKYPDATCEHTHAIVYVADTYVGSFDIERAISVTASPNSQ